ncbi:Uma2 family endonuclease [Nocardiopsis sp. RSe5-2]|uniref:Uma2 family endonuclease n=1 Tax=Nocardiopsis endophytica TaxID=3018445 RepID=A0ABT4U5Z5_9ACTN|nr:Uma2 family endonuclease [Nocardiopsis endophytica]MDA2812369.1 Uma2 family endonuclease [Nocardiopsis endophytica]
MTAPRPDTAPLPDWVIPPPEGFSADDFLRMSGLPPHTELIDGSLIFVSPQRKWHSGVVGRFWVELDAQAPEGWRADREMALKVGFRQVPEPDVLVVREEAFLRKEPDTYYLPEEVLLVIEAVSPDSEDRDRETKPAKYARAGIPHFWRIEEADSDSAVVYAYEFDPETRAYVVAGIHHDRFTASSPFPIDIDLKEIRRRRAR